jgi:cytidylate kinase
MSRIITIGREFGSGGRELGRRLAEELKMDYYDKEIISEIVEHTSLSEEYIQNLMENRPRPLYPITIGHSFVCVDSYAFQQVQSVYQAQHEVIQKLASKSDCVIVGRCADYILREQNPYRIFVYADMDSRIKRCRDRSTEQENYTDKELKHQIQKIDKGRAKYYENYTGQKWGAKINYDLCINTTNANIKTLVAGIAKFFADK